MRAAGVLAAKSTGEKENDKNSVKIAIMVQESERKKFIFYQKDTTRHA